MLSSSSKSVASHNGFYALHFCEEENIVVRDLVLPRIPQDLTMFHLMESFKYANVSWVSHAYRKGEITIALFMCCWFFVAWASAGLAVEI